MIGIDTNLLVRFLTQDDEAQSSKANELIESYSNQKEILFLNNIVLCELIWVLERGYKYGRSLISPAIKQILSTAGFKFENIEVLWLALEDYEKSKRDFADILIGKTNKLVYGCNFTITFDKQAAISDDFSLLN